MHEERFRLAGRVVSCERCGSGHINGTYLVRTDAPKKYIMQEINRQVFRDVPALMRNIALVTRFLAREDKDPRHVLTLVPTNEGEDWFEDEQGRAWRAYEYVENSVCLDQPRTLQEFAQSGRAFGEFQRKLAGFDAAQLAETIPHFHDTPARCLALHEAAARDALGRAAGVQREIDFALSHEKEAGAMTGMLARGELPLRVTHNDTKLNNILLDAQTGEPLCVIDLDTVMPGLAGNDFGDSIRFGASTALEDERDLVKVELSLERYEAYARAFLGACGASLTRAEIETLPLGAKLMTYENGVRFLTDYLSGDVYFHIEREGQNLDRARTQFKLIEDMEKKWARIARLTEEAAKA